MSSSPGKVYHDLIQATAMSLTTTDSPRYTRAVGALLDAYAAGTLCPGDPLNDALGSVVRGAQGHVDGALWKALLAYRFDRLTVDQVLYLSEIERATSYSTAELSLIEEAFEMDPDADLFERVQNVVRTLETMETQSVSEAPLAVGSV